jgi:hypothetical protein
VVDWFVFSSMLYEFLATIVGMRYVDLFLSGFNDSVVCILSHRGSLFSLHFIIFIKVATKLMDHVVKVKSELNSHGGFTYPQ